MRTPCIRKGGCVFARYGWCEGCRLDVEYGRRWLVAFSEAAHA